MSLYLVSVTAAATLLSDDPVIPAAQLEPLREATAVLAAAGRLQQRIAAESERATAAAQAAGFAAGHAQAVADGAERISAELARIMADAAAERQRLRADVSRLAVEVVRRIAGELGPPEVVAGLAQHAAANLLPDATAVVRVSTAAQELVAARLADAPGLTVIGDAALEDYDCRFETPLGVSHAGLETQLAAVDRAWRAAAPVADNAG